MENFDNWEMLKTAVEAEETEEILTREIITDFENITKHQNDALTIKKEKEDKNYDFYENHHAVDSMVLKNNNDVTIKKESIEISVDETDLDDGMDDDAIFNFTNEVNVTRNDEKSINETYVEESRTKDTSANFTLTGRPIRAAAIAKSGLTQKQALDEPPLDYECAIIYMCPSCGCEYFSHEAWKRHMHMQHKFNTREGLNFKKIDKLYNECQQCLKHIAMHSIENLLKHKFTHLPYRCTKCRICMRQYKYRQDLMVHLRMTHLTDLVQIKRTGEWTKENETMIERERMESINSSSSIFAIKNVQANAIDIHADAEKINDYNIDNDVDEHDDNTVCVQNERLELDEDDKLIEYDSREINYQNEITGIKQKSLLESALCGEQQNDVEDSFTEPDIKLCDPYIMHICPQCGDTYEKQEQWQEHIEEVHNFGDAIGLGFKLHEDNLVMCKECSKKMPNELNQLQLHRFSHTRHRQWMRCSLCYRAFTLLKDLIRHLLVQHNLANSPADDYEDMENYQLETSHRDNFEQHIEYLCPQCGRNYKDRKLWRRHLIYAHRLADLKVLHFRVINETQVICLDCSKVITNAYGIQNAQQHRFTHMPFKAYIRCRICNKSYTERKGTVKHLRKTHHISITNNKPVAKAKLKETTAGIKFRFEDNNSYYRKRTIDQSNNEPKKEIVRTNNYMYEIKFLDDDKSQNLDNYSFNNNNRKNNISDHDYDDIDDNAAVPELLFVDHKSTNSTNFKCNYCAARFTKESSLTAHMTESHRKKKVTKQHDNHYDEPPSSKKIRLQDNSKDKLMESNKVNLENYYYFLCPACGREYPEQTSWRQHINEEHHFNKRHGLNFKPISPCNYQCLQCDVIVDSKLQTMQEHKFGHLPFVSCVKCRLCMAAFSWKSSMLEHLYIIHNISEMETNVIRPEKKLLQQSNEESKLLKISTAITRKSPTTAPVLHAAITNSSGTEYAHNAVDHATITYFCPMCNVNFVTHYMWRRHIVDEHNFNNCEGLNFRKINEHHFLCLQCYKRVTVTHTKGAICQLQSHKFRHLPYRSFKCTACNEMFVRKQMFFKHLNKFTNTCGFIKQTTQNVQQNITLQIAKFNDNNHDNSNESDDNKNKFVNIPEDLNLPYSNVNEKPIQPEEAGGKREHFMFVCPSCGSEFYKLHLWREHINTEHHLNVRDVLNFKRITATQHQCLQCLEYVNGRKLRDLQAHKFKHLTHTHYLRCLLCKASYTHLRNMQDHIRNRHPEFYIDKLNNTEVNKTVRSSEDAHESCHFINSDADVSTSDFHSTEHFESSN